MRPDYQFALSIHQDRLHPFVLNPDPRRVRARRDNEIVFHLSAVAVVFQVNAGVDLFIDDGLVIGNIGPPPGWVVAEEVVALVVEKIFTTHNRTGVRTHKRCLYQHRFHHVAAKTI